MSILSSKTSVTVAALSLAVSAASCSKKKGDDSSDTTQEIPRVTTLEQPEPLIMQDSGTTAETPDDTTPSPAPAPITLKAKGTDDLRPNAPVTYVQPSTQNLDPRSFTPPTLYQPGVGSLARSIFSGQLAVPYDGRAHVLPACAYPIPAPGRTSTAGLTIDGNLSEWPAASVVSIDQVGDAVAPALDLKEIYFAKDSNYIYLGAKVSGNWATGNSPAQRMLLEFKSVTLPADNSTLPAATSVRRFEIWGSTLNEYVSGSYGVVSGSGTTYNLAVNGSGVELKIDIHRIEDLMGGKPYVVDVSTWDPSTGKFDYTGKHVVGFVDDYACLVPMPEPDKTQTRYNMFVMRRTDPTIDAGVAETIYRSMIAGAPAAEYVAKDKVTYWRTIAFSVIKAMEAAGLNHPHIGLFVAHNVYNVMGEVGDPTYLTFVSAHEYLHTFNAVDYHFPENWLREGHSNWLATRAVGSYFGNSVAQQLFNYDTADFQKQEGDHGVQTISDAAWGQAPYDGLFYYHKAAAYFEILSKKLTYGDFLNGALSVGRTGSAPANRDAFLTSVKATASYNGASKDNLTAGWWGGDYVTSVLPLTLVKDDDKDGVLNFQETALGTKPNAIDSDGDHASDLSESILSLNPTKAQAVDYIVKDNSLDDWAALIPNELHTSISSSNTTAPCGTHTKISRYGAIFTEGWLYIGVETAAQAADDQPFSVVVFFSGSSEQILAPHGSQVVWHLTPNTRPVISESPFSGKTVEIAYNSAWLGWSGGTMPADFKINIATFSGSTQCDLAPVLAPSTSF